MLIKTKPIIEGQSKKDTFVNTLKSNRPIKPKPTIAEQKKERKSNRTDTTSKYIDIELNPCNTKL